MNKIGMISAVMVLIAGMAFADTTVNGNVDVPVLSSFDSRGRVFQDETVIEPSITVNVPTTNGVFTANIWGNMAPNDYASVGDSTFNEIDLTVGYASSLNNVNYGVGIIEYVYSGTEIPNTHEAYVTLGYATILNPTVSVYYDFKEANSAYVFAGVSHTVKVCTAVTATADTGIGWGSYGYNELYFGIEDDSLNDWSSGLIFTAAVYHNLALYTGIRYSELLDSGIEDGAKAIYGDGNKVVGKAGATLLF